MMWQDCKYCGEDFQDIRRRVYCDTCTARHKKYPLPKNSSTMRMIRNREFIKNQKMNKNCLRCGYNQHPEIIEFHHKNKSEKVAGVCELAKSLKSIYIIKKEIEKCDLICPNCHREEHLLEKYGKSKRD